MLITLDYQNEMYFIVHQLICKFIKSRMFLYDFYLGIWLFNFYYNKKIYQSQHKNLQHGYF